MINTVDGAIEEKLKNSTSVTNLVAQAIYSNIADQPTTQDAAPYVVIIVDAREDEQRKDNTAGGISVYKLYTDIYHRNLPTAISIAVAIRASLQDYEGSHGNVDIQEMWETNEQMAVNEEVDLHIFRIEWTIRRIF